MRILFLILFLMNISSHAYAVDIDLNSYEGAKAFKTRLSEGFKIPANIAEEYVAIYHGCGTLCQVYWVANKNSGKIIGNITTSEGLDFKKDSKLAIASKYMSEGAYYYLIDNDQIILVREDGDAKNAN